MYIYIYIGEGINTWCYCSGHIFLLSVISSRPLSVLNSSRVLFIDIQVLVSYQRTPFVPLVLKL